jgi:hypothetical protein
MLAVSISSVGRSRNRRCSDSVNQGGKVRLFCLSNGQAAMKSSRGVTFRTTLIELASNGSTAAVGDAISTGYEEGASESSFKNLEGAKGRSGRESEN